MANGEAGTMDMLTCALGTETACERAYPPSEKHFKAVAISMGFIGGSYIVAATPEMYAAAQVALQNCKTNPIQCLNNASIQVAEALTPEGTGAAGALVIGKTASEVKALKTAVASKGGVTGVIDDVAAAGKRTTGTTSNGYKVSNGADTIIAKTDLDHPIVQSRINVQNGNNKIGWDHVVDRHFSDKNASQFTISQSELKTILQSNEVSKVPINRVIDSADGLRYERVITFDKNIGVDKFSKNPTNTMTILTDAKGNLITTTPGRIK